MKILAKLASMPSTICFHRKGEMFFKAFQEENLAMDEWFKYIKTELELLELDNLIGNK